MSSRRVLLALRPGSPLHRLLDVAATLCRRLDAELDVLADPARSDIAEIQSRLADLGASGLPVTLSQVSPLTAAKVIAHAQRHESIVSVVVGRPAAWSAAGEDPWARLDCPLVAASDPPESSNNPA